MQTTWKLSAVAAGFALLLGASSVPGSNVKSEREKIGESLCKPVYRDEIRTGNDVSLAGELHCLFASQAVEEYRRIHKKEITPTEAEITRAADALTRILKERGTEPGVPARQLAVFMLSNWKFQRHLYDHFGGGRILWQQAGTEAFDAMHKWLQSLEKAGKFRFTDPNLRAAFYAYWTTHNHGAFLTDDKERIRKEFLEPEWLK